MKALSLVKLTQNLLADGKYFFTKEFVSKKLAISDAALSLQINRLKKKRSIFGLRAGFYMIVPAEFSHMGTLPPLWIIDPLMKYLGYSYYVGLLSSASIYGASNQQPQIFQVICNAQVPEIKLSRGAIQFYKSQEMDKACIEQIKTPTSYATIASKEQTALDLVKYYKAAGYFNNVATILSELCAELDIVLFSKALECERSPSHIQRLGYIMEMLGFDDLANCTEAALANHKGLCYRKLRPDLNTRESIKSARWKLIINDQIEIDE